MVTTNLKMQKTHNKKLMQKNQSYGLEKQAAALFFCIAWRYVHTNTKQCSWL